MTPSLPAISRIFVPNTTNAFRLSGETGCLCFDEELVERVLVGKRDGAMGDHDELFRQLGGEQQNLGQMKILSHDSASNAVQDDQQRVSGEVVLGDVHAHGPVGASANDSFMEIPSRKWVVTVAEELLAVDAVQVDKLGSGKDERSDAAK